MHEVHRPLFGKLVWTDLKHPVLGLGDAAQLVEYLPIMREALGIDKPGVTAHTYIPMDADQFKAILNYTASLRPAWATHPVLPRTGLMYTKLLRTVNHR